MKRNLDAAWKMLFSTREIVRDLVTGFVGGAWVQVLDLDTLEKVPTHFVDRRMRQRVTDVPVGRKLFTGFAALTVVLMLVVMCLFLTVARLGEANSAIVDVAAKRSETADHLRFNAADLRAAQQAYVLGETAGRAEFDQAATRFEATLDEMRTLTDDAPAA